MKTVDHMHEWTGALSIDDTQAPWLVLFVRPKTLFRQSRWVAEKII